MTADDSESVAAAVAEAMPQKESCCTCGCRFCPTRGPSSWQRSVKRKLEDVEAGSPRGAALLRSAMPSVDVLARVEIENECSALREALARQQQKIQELSTELEEERNSSYTAANEAMSMILRLQREKAEIQMEARQFKRFAEEKMAHDQEEIVELEELFYKRDQTVQALSYELQSYKHRLLSYGINPNSDPAADFVGTPHGAGAGAGEINYYEENNDAAATAAVGNDAPSYEENPYPSYDYPPLRCISVPDTDVNDDVVEFDKYAPGDTPRTPGKREQLQHIERRINQMERSFSNGHLSGVLEKGVVVGNSPRRRRTSRQLSIDSTSSFLNRDHSGGGGGGVNGSRATADQGSDAERDDMSDRVYTIDTVHGAAPKAPAVGLFDDHVNTPRDSVAMGSVCVEDVDIKKLYMRLQALEADRESLKQTIISMRTDSTQLVLLKEIAQNLYKGMAQPAPERKLVKKPSVLASLSCTSLFKWIVSFLSWKKKAGRCKYTFGLTSSNVGLLLAIDRSPNTRHRRCLTRRRSSIASHSKLQFDALPVN